MDCNDDGKTVPTKLQEAWVIDACVSGIEPAEEELVKEGPVDPIPSDGVEEEDTAEFEFVRRPHDPFLSSKSFTSRFLFRVTSQENENVYSQV